MHENLKCQKSLQLSDCELLLLHITRIFSHFYLVLFNILLFNLLSTEAFTAEGIRPFVPVRLTGTETRTTWTHRFDLVAVDSGAGGAGLGDDVLGMR